MKVRTANGEEKYLIVEVPKDGAGIHGSISGRVPVIFGPEDVSRLRKIFHEAQAVAMQDRGTW